MKEVNAANAYRADRVPVVGLRQRRKPSALLLAGLLVELECHFQGDLDGSGSGVGEKCAAQGGCGSRNRFE